MNNTTQITDQNFTEEVRMSGGFCILAIVNRQTGKKENCVKFLDKRFDKDDTVKTCVYEYGKSSHLQHTLKVSGDLTYVAYFKGIRLEDLKDKEANDLYEFNLWFKNQYKKAKQIREGLNKTAIEEVSEKNLVIEDSIYTSIKKAEKEYNALKNTSLDFPYLLGILTKSQKEIIMANKRSAKLEKRVMELEETSDQIVNDLETIKSELANDNTKKSIFSVFGGQ